MRLRALDPPSPVVCFVLLWTYYDDGRLAEAENRLVGAKVQPFRLREPALAGLGSKELRRCLDGLGGSSKGVAFDKYALGLLKALDRTLEDVTPAILDGEVGPGFDNGTYRVRRFVNPIADRFGLGSPPQARQGVIAAYARRCIAVPVDSVRGLRIECVRVEALAPAVHKRLLQARDEFSVSLWPFQGRIEYPALDHYGEEPPAAFVALKDPRNEQDLKEQVKEAIEVAATKRTTILVFPELAFSPAMIDVACTTLAAHGVGGYPILTVAGLCHRLIDPASGVHVNEAVVLGPDGRELHRHRKLRRFTNPGLTSEEIETGSTLGVIETACGNLAIPICLDLFAPDTKPLLLASHATVLLVPSLSAKTGPHEGAAREYAAAQLASTFVCNRTLAGFESKAASFCRLPGPDPESRDDGAAPCLRFSLHE